MKRESTTERQSNEHAQKMTEHFKEINNAIDIWLVVWMISDQRFHGMGGMGLSKMLVIGITWAVWYCGEEATKVFD